MIEVNQMAQNFDFILVFNNNESLYYMEDYMPDETEDKNLLTLAKLSGFGTYKYYQNKKENFGFETIYIRWKKNCRGRFLKQQAKQLDYYKRNRCNFEL